MNGKGDAQRPTDLKRFRKNYDSIDWGSGVVVHHEPDDFKRCPPENCSDCQTPTRYWLDPHTPLCPNCAAKYKKGNR